MDMTKSLLSLMIQFASNQYWKTENGEEVSIMVVILYLVLLHYRNNNA